MPVSRGAGQTIAIVDAFDDPTAASDLARYRSKNGLAPCTTSNGCFRKLNESGAAGPYPPADPGWGIEISLDALSERGARLPRVDLAPPKSVIGKNTIDAIRSGVVFGYAGAIDAILRRLYEELGTRADVIATGGLAHLVVPYTEELEEVDDLLTLTGLRLLHERDS